VSTEPSALPSDALTDKILRKPTMNVRRVREALRGSIPCEPPADCAFGTDRWVLSGALVLASQRYLVYILCDGWDVLYVGVGKGLGRPLGISHEKMVHAQPHHHLVIIWQADKYAAWALESSLIRLLRPAWNVAGCPGAKPRKRLHRGKWAPPVVQG
jgi:hypothetical protein